MRFKALRGSPKGKAQRGQYLLVGIWACGVTEIDKKEHFFLFFASSIFSLMIYFLKYKFLLSKYNKILDARFEGENLAKDI